MATALPTFVEILACFLLATSLLNRYSDMVNNNIVTIVGVFISWFFSFMVIFMLPTDLTSTAYRQCLLDFHADTNNSSRTPFINTSSLINSAVHETKPLPQNIVPITTDISSLSNKTLSDGLLNPVANSRANLSAQPSNTTIVNTCNMPWNYISDVVLVKLWRFIYWTSQFLTWFLLPIMQSYSMSGEFTALDRFKSALKANLIYYSSIGAIFFILLVYVILKNGIDFANLKVIVITSSNTWGLFLLVVLLGYGLVELPRFLLNRSRHFQSLSRHYFKVGKLNAEKCEAEEKLDDVLEEVHRAYGIIGEDEKHPLYLYLRMITNRCPPDWKRRSNTFRRQVTVYDPDLKNNEYDLSAMIGLHKRVIKAVHYHRQVLCRWNRLIGEVIELEDVARNFLDNQGSSPTRVFKSTLPKERSLLHTIYTPKLEWYWKCLVRVWLFRVIGIVATVLSSAIVWSEMTFPTASFAPRLSIFAYFVDNFQASQHYFYLESFSTVSIGYLAICAFYTVFHMKIYNIYYLASNKQTDEYSLSFSGMLVCRLTAPLCLNYLCLINRDSHFIKQDSTRLETSFTTIMGHLDLIPIVNSGLNIFLPLCISAICLAIYFDYGTRLLHHLGYEQFMENDEMTGDLVQTGRELVDREKGKLLRNFETSSGAYHEMITPNAQTSSASNSITITSS